MPRSTSSLTAAGCVSAYASASVLPHEPPNTSQRSILEMAAQALHVGDEMPGRVGFERSVRAAAPGAALIEHDDAVARRDRRSAAH